MVVVGGASRQPVRRSTAMLIIGTILGFVGLGYLCWLIFALAVYALPLFAGATAGFAAYHTNAGPIAAIAVAAIVSVIVLLAGQTAFRTLHSTPVRAVIALMFTVPAAVSGYHAAHGLAYLVIPTEWWRQKLWQSSARSWSRRSRGRAYNLVCPERFGPGIAAPVRSLTSLMTRTRQIAAPCLAASDLKRFRSLSLMRCARLQRLTVRAKPRPRLP
jgi:hypothetical protein